jgi:hypothetical protein
VGPTLQPDAVELVRNLPSSTPTGAAPTRLPVPIHPLPPLGDVVDSPQPHLRLPKLPLFLPGATQFLVDPNSFLLLVFMSLHFFGFVANLRLC